eukprot:5816670-Amphidinium_carterae.1
MDVQPKGEAVRQTIDKAAPLAIGTGEKSEVAQIKKFFDPYETARSHHSIIPTFVVGCSAIQPHNPSLEHPSETAQQDVWFIVWSRPHAKEVVETVLRHQPPTERIIS